MMWAALYQQRPAPEDGDYFKADWLKPYEALPPRETLRVYGGSDYAVTADGGDYTVHIVVGLDPEGRMYLMDLWRKQRFRRMDRGLLRFGHSEAGGLGRRERADQCRNRSCTR